MPSFEEVAVLAARNIEVSVRGVKFRICENFMLDPKAQVQTRLRIQKLLKDTEKAVADARKLKGASNGDSDQELDIILASAKMQNSIDEREQVVAAVCSRIRSWDVTDKNEVMAPLTEKELYESGCPTKFLQELLEAVDKEPIVPNGK